MASIYSLLDLLNSPVSAPFFESPLAIGDASTDNAQGDQVSVRHHGRHRGGHRNWDVLAQGPRLDIHENDSEYVAVLEVPGAKKEDVELSVDESKRRVTVTGSIKASYQTPTQQQQQEQGDKSKGNGDKQQQQKASTTPNVLVSERMYGSFQRSFTLPQTADLSKTQAKFQDGLLHINVAKKEKSEAEQRRTISIA